MTAPMERHGFFGILKVTTRIIHSNLKHFLFIGLIFLLPYAFLVAFSPPLNIKALAAIIAMIRSASKGQLSPQPDDNDPIQPYPFPTLTFIIAIFSGLFIVLVSVPPLTFSICRGYLNKNLKIKGSLKAIPRSIKNIIITKLCLFAAYMVIFIAIFIAMIILIVCFQLILSAVNVNSTIPVIILSLGLIVVVLYFSIVCSLVYPVTILEESRGWDAIRRSIYLLDGSKWLAFWLIVFFSICGLFLQILVSKDASVLWKFSVATVRVTLQALIALYSMATQVVLFLSCKIRHKEPVETLVAANDEFGEDLANLSKYMDIESANLNAQPAFVVV